MYFVTSHRLCCGCFLGLVSVCNNIFLVAVGKSWWGTWRQLCMLSSHHEWFTGLFYLTQDNNLLNDCKLCKSHLPDFLSVCFRIDLRCHSLAPTHVSVFVVPYAPWAPWADIFYLPGSQLKTKRDRDLQSGPGGSGMSSLGNQTSCVSHILTFMSKLFSVLLKFEFPLKVWTMSAISTVSFFLF